MKRLNIVAILILVFVLSSCRGANIVDRTMTFSTHEDISIEVEEYIWADGTTVTVENGYYLPEVSTVCFDLSITDATVNPVYIAYFSYQDGNNYSTQGYNGLGTSEHTEYTQVCHEDIEYNEYSFTLYRESKLTNSSMQLLEVNFDLGDINPDETFDVSLELINTTNLSPELEVKMNFLDGGEYVNGSFYYEVFDDYTGKVIYEFSVEMAALAANESSHSVFVGDLLPNTEYGARVYYDPFSDQTVLLRFGFMRINTLSAEEDDPECLSHYLCAFVGGNTIGEDSTTFDLFVVNSEEFINEDTMNTHIITIEFYKEYHELIYSETLIDGQRILVVSNSEIEEYTEIIITCDLKVNMAIDGPPAFEDLILFWSD